MAKIRNELIGNCKCALEIFPDYHALSDGVIRICELISYGQSFIVMLEASFCMANPANLTTIRDELLSGDTI